MSVKLPKESDPQVLSRIGKWSHVSFKVSKEQSDRTRLRAALKGRGFVPEGTYESLVHDDRGIVMSNTPDEISDHSEFVHKASGVILINGLGLGVALGMILDKRNVTQVTVVEIDKDVIQLIGSKFSDSRLTIVNEDAFKYQPEAGTHYDCVWHDIWDSISRDNLRDMSKLKLKYRNRAKWQGFWGRDHI